MGIEALWSRGRRWLGAGLVGAGLVALGASSGVEAGIDPGNILKKRGDANADDRVDLSDAVYLLLYLYESGDEPPCLNQADVNYDGIVNPSDVQYLLNWLFNGGTAPPDPGGPGSEGCSFIDASLNLGCDSYEHCFPF